LPFEAALAEAAGHQDAVDAFERSAAAPLDLLGLDPAQVHARALLRPPCAAPRRATCRRRVADVLADDRDVHLAVGVLDGSTDAVPFGQVGRRR
jgi:hypothetical protein